MGTEVSSSENSDIFSSSDTPPASPTADVDIFSESVTDASETAIIPKLPPDIETGNIPRLAIPVESENAWGGQVFLSRRSKPATNPIPIDIDLNFKRKSRRSTRQRRGKRDSQGLKSISMLPAIIDKDGGSGVEPPSVSANGELVVPLRPIRTEEGYQSIYSAMTRTTVWTVLRTSSRVLGETTITLGLIILLFAAYEVWGVGAQVNAHQNVLSDQLARDWNVQPAPSISVPSPTPSSTPARGQPIAKLYIPRIQKAPWTVVQGVSPDDIRYAPGHYPWTAMPGDIGNFSVAGHRTLKIFWNLDQVRQGDPIIVETKDSWFIYTATYSHIVSPDASEVVAPVPNEPGAAPTTSMVTLTTCHPKNSNSQRFIVHGIISGRQPHDAGPPAEIGN